MSSTTTTDEGNDQDQSGEDVGDEFYFESDELALKGNADYLSLLRTVAVLEAQRSKAIKDIDRLVECEKLALADPIQFVERLQQDNSLDMPALQQIASLPIIDWDKYAKSFNCLASIVGTGSGPTAGFNSISHRHMTRQIKKRSTSVGHRRAFVGLETTTAALEGADQASTSMEEILEITSRQADIAADAANQLVVRGRLPNFGTGKPSQTFNQLWTVEEQKRLEDCLIKFPPEEVEARRWEKVATALGNRTPQQVASRVQKYFIKLTKAGLPVPGRIPNLSSYSRRPFCQNNHYHKHHRHNRFLFGPSTFLASHEPPVFMSDMDDEHSMSSNTGINISTTEDDDDADDEDIDDDDVPIELRYTDEYRELLLLRRMKRKKMRRGGDVGQHFGYRCDGCNCEPIVGNRWHCVTCPSNVAIDLCDMCSSSNFDNGVHNSSHCLEPIRSSHVDGDYTQFLQGDYNYLDPNYMPACT